MITITPATKARWNKAIDKCRAEKPKVRSVSHGVYSVSGSKGDAYTVTWTAPKGGDVTVECSCKAGKKNTPCYHIPPTASLWKQALAEKQAARVACFTPECDGEVITDGLCVSCLEYSELSRIAQQRQAEAVALVECRQCHEFSPAEDMLSVENPVCINCVLFN